MIYKNVIMLFGDDISKFVKKFKPEEIILDDAAVYVVRYGEKDREELDNNIKKSKMSVYAVSIAQYRRVT